MMRLGGTGNSSSRPSAGTSVSEHSSGNCIASLRDRSAGGGGLSQMRSPMFGHTCYALRKMAEHPVCGSLNARPAFPRVPPRKQRHGKQCAQLLWIVLALQKAVEQRQHRFERIAAAEIGDDPLLDVSVFPHRGNNPDVLVDGSVGAFDFDGADKHDNILLSLSFPKNRHQTRQNMSILWRICGRSC